MKTLILKENYHSYLNIIETEVAIKLVKDTFERDLAKALNLTRVSAPLFVFPKSGLNDNLNGYERRVEFDINGIDEPVEIVQSLAKWKRNALKEYEFSVGTGLYTDMNAIRRDEDLDSIHSAYVDQWDWELIINKEDRNINFLKKIVRKIYKCLRTIEAKVVKDYPELEINLPTKVSFITTQSLEDKYPNLTMKQREYEITKELGAVFIMQIGSKLKSGLPHDGRAADYDDWKLNGDLMVYDSDLDIALELSSMGIRVDSESIQSQIKEKGEFDKFNNKYVKDVISGELPLTIGGGIGQSRLCMLLLRKAHIGEVQASMWSEEDINLLKKYNIKLL